MTYREKFDASQRKAHYQNIATKILKEMTTLRSRVDNSTSIPRRWIWELIQNAKDVHPDEGVRIQIEFQSKSEHSEVVFRHNGRPFTADNIRFLIEQVSTKDRTKDEEGRRKETGKFGTGFLTTHLLSETVKVEGVAKEPELSYRKFELELDRSGLHLEQITAAVQQATLSMEDLDSRPAYVNYREGDLNTAFHYPINDESGMRVAQVGLRDLDNCLAYSLVFVEEIKNVELLPSKRVFRKSNTSVTLSDSIRLVSVEAKEKSKVSTVHFAQLTKGFTSIIVPVAKDGDSIELLPIEDQVARLFCDFPLIGTEKFAFPAVINNPHFNPTDPRDGILLTTPLRPDPNTDENKAIIQEAVALYFQLLKFATMHDWKNLHLLAPNYHGSAALDWLDDNWFRNQVVNPIRKELLQAEIVRTVNGALASILSKKDGSKFIWFPNSSKKEIRQKLWSCARSWFPSRLPRESDVELWYQLSWHECGKLTVDQLAAFLEHLKTVHELKKAVIDRDAFEWLNEFYSVMKLEDKEYDSIINKRAIFPNQNGDFCKKADLYKDFGNIGDEFKDLLKLLKIDLRADLLSEAIGDDSGTKGVRDQAYAVREITSEIGEKATDREVAKSFRVAFKKLLLYFQKNPKQAKVLFPNLYHNKHYLYDDEEILENLNKAEQVNDLLSEFNVKEIAELRELLVSSQAQPDGLLPITQEILASMGISSVEEWTKALEDKDLAALFSHKSTPTREMFVFAQTQIQKCKRKIIEHLRTLDNYDLSQMDETALTVLAGVFKDGQSISIVVRPAYNGEVIVYYDSERDVLDYEHSELWIDDGTQPRQITLGHILKKAQIVKFPV